MIKYVLFDRDVDPKPQSSEVPSSESSNDVSASSNDIPKVSQVVASHPTPTQEESAEETETGIKGNWFNSLAPGRS